MGLFRNITRRSWAADNQGRAYTPLRVLAQLRWLEYFGKEGLHDAYYKPLVPANYPQDPQSRQEIPQGYRTWYGLEGVKTKTSAEEGIDHDLFLPTPLNEEQYITLNGDIEAHVRNAKQQKADAPSSEQREEGDVNNPYSADKRVFFGQLWTWRKLVPPMGIFNLIKFTWAITFDLFDWCLQHIQMRPYADQESRWSKAGFVLWMPVFTLIRGALYLAFNIPLSVLEILTSPINKVLRPILRFYDDFEPTTKGKSRGPFFAALSIAILATVFIGGALFLSSTAVFAYAPIFQHVLMAANAFFEHALTLLPFALNAAAVVAVKTAAIFITFVGSMRFLEGVATHLRNGVPDAFGFITGKGGDEKWLDAPIIAGPDQSNSPYAETKFSRETFGTRTEIPHCMHVKHFDQFATFFGRSKNSGHPEPVADDSPNPQPK